MLPKIEFYRVNAPKVYFSPSDALAAGCKTLPFVEIEPELVFLIAENSFGIEISELKDAYLSACDVLPTREGSCGDISQLKEISTRSFLNELDAGYNPNAVFEGNGLFIAIFGTDETWLVHSRPNCDEIFEQFSHLLDYSKNNVELLRKSAIFAPYFAGAA
jgi:hypothetical protein